MTHCAWVDGRLQPGGGPEPSPGEIFGPAGRLAPSQIRAQVSHTAKRLGQMSSRQGGTMTIESWLLALAVSPDCDGLTSMAAELLGLLLVCAASRCHVAERIREHSSLHLKARGKGRGGAAVWQERI